MVTDRLRMSHRMDYGCVTCESRDRLQWVPHGSQDGLLISHNHIWVTGWVTGWVTDGS